MSYSLNFASCIFTIADVDGNEIKEYDLPIVEVFYDDQYITIKDIDTEFKLHISELSGVDSGAYATFEDMRDAIIVQKVACVSSGGGSETATTMGALINTATNATPNNSDYVATAESGGVLKKISWTNVKAFLKTYFDTLYPTSNAPITGATKTKITYDSKGFVTSGADATTADIADSTNKRYVTDAQLVVIGNTSGTNSGNETTSSIGSLINGATSAIPNDTDLVATAESSVLKKITWTNVKTFLKTYFDTIYTTTSAVASQITTALGGYLTITTASATYQVILTASNFGTFLTGLTSKTTPIDADEIAISDSSSSNVGKKVSLINFKSYLKTYFDTLYQSALGYTPLNKAGDTITGDINNSSTGYFQIPSGTTAQRPASPVNGMRRYNTTTARDEFYANGSWQNHTRLSGDTFTGAISATNLSGTNTGDETASTIGTIINGATSYTTPLDADKVGIWDNLNSLYKAVSWSNIKATLKTYFDTKYTKYLLKSTADGTNVTGTTSDTLSYSGLIPANSVSVGDVLRLFSFTEYGSGGGGTKRARAYINTSASLSGATLLATTPNAGTSTRSIGFDRYLGVKSASVTRVHNSGVSDYTNSVNSSTASTSANIDWTIDQYLIISIQLSVGTDSGLSSFVILEKI